jgi:hypothetical protein
MWVEYDALRLGGPRVSNVASAGMLCERSQNAIVTQFQRFSILTGDLTANTC